MVPDAGYGRMTFLGWLTIFLFVIAADGASRCRSAATWRPSTPASARSWTGSWAVRSGCSTGSCASIRRGARIGRQYAKSLIIFSLAGWLLLYFILRTQTLWNFTGLNPEHFHSAPWNVTFNTTSSFMTNTNWQYYGGETTMSYFSQMAGLTVQNFLSAGVGIVVAVALIRGIVSRSGKSLGNFWQDIIRTSCMC